MAAVTFAVSDPDTTAASSYPILTFTPAVDDLLVVCVSFAGSDTTTGAVFDCTDDQSGTYTKVAEAHRDANQHGMAMFVRDQAVTSAVGHIVTVTCTGDPATGNITDVYRVAGMTKYGATAIKQFATQSNVGNSVPEPVFGASVLTGNPVIGMAANNNGTTPTFVVPSGWTEGAQSNHLTPNHVMQSVYRDSGFTGTTVTWGSLISLQYADIVVELDASGAAGGVAVRGTTPWVRIGRARSMG